MPMDAMNRHITFENTVQNSLPSSLWSGSTNRIISHNIAKTVKMAATAGMGP